MSLTATKLNPIHFFNQSDPIFWNNNKNVPDRGGWVRKWPYAAPTVLFFESSSTPVIDGFLCKNRQSSGGSPMPVTSLGSNMYRIDMPMDQLSGVVKSNLAYQITNASSEAIIRQGVSTPPASFVVNTTSRLVQQCVIDSSVVLTKVEFDISVSVAMVDQVLLRIYKVESLNRFSFVEVGQVLLTVSGTGNKTISFTIPTIASRAWGKNDVIMFALECLWNR